MASKAHAFFCFEVLAARFEDADHPGLQTVLDLYDTSTISSVSQEPLEGDAEEIEVEEVNGATNQQDIQKIPQLPSIVRLQGSIPSSLSQTSSPASLSVNSSTSQLTSSTATSITSPPSVVSRLSVNESYPLFVTWNTLSRSGHKSLRGCIGTFSGMPLEEGLEQYALTSAFDDTRFSPIPSSLLPSLSCSLTLLADFEECSGPLDWDLGTHGIRISFMHRHQKHGATYLPDVAVEQGWNKEETLDSLMRKAGWSSSGGRFSRASSRPWQEVKDFKVVRYTGLKASASYTEWQEWRATTTLASKDDV
jgi:uncharacterized protein (TIGR00296 family)